MHLAYHLLSALVAVSVLPLPTLAGHSPRRHHINRRDDRIDQCATITPDALAAVGLTPPKDDTCSPVCVCHSQVLAAIQTVGCLPSITNDFGQELVRKRIKELISCAEDMQECQHPANSQADCRTDNPCNFNCTAPFVQEDDQCVCKHPFHLCNGVCTAADQACSSAPADRRNINPNLRARTHGIYTHRDAQSTCAYGEKVCGVNQGSNAYECINTDTALESCGGCVTANPFIPASEQVLDGVDCTTIPNVKNVICSGGHCIVESCTGTYVPSSDQSACIATLNRLFV